MTEETQGSGEIILKLSDNSEAGIAMMLNNPSHRIQAGTDDKSSFLTHQL